MTQESRETGDEALEWRHVLWRSDEKFVENALKYLSCSLVLNFQFKTCRGRMPLKKQVQTQGKWVRESSSDSNQDGDTIYLEMLGCISALESKGGCNRSGGAEGCWHGWGCSAISSHSSSSSVGTTEWYGGGGRVFGTVKHSASFTL